MQSPNTITICGESKQNKQTPGRVGRFLVPLFVLYQTVFLPSNIFPFSLVSRFLKKYQEKTCFNILSNNNLLQCQSTLPCIAQLDTGYNMQFFGVNRIVLHWWLLMGSAFDQENYQIWSLFRVIYVCTTKPFCLTHLGAVYEWEHRFYSDYKQGRCAWKWR